MPDRTSLTTLADDAHLLELYRQALKEYKALAQHPGLRLTHHGRIFHATLQAIEEAEAKAGPPPDAKVHRLCDEIESAVSSSSWTGTEKSCTLSAVARFRALAGPIDWEQRGKELAEAVGVYMQDWLTHDGQSSPGHKDLHNALERFHGNCP